MGKLTHPILFNIFVKEPYFRAIVFRFIVLGVSSIDTYYMWKLQPEFWEYVSNWGQVATNLFYLFWAIQAIFKVGGESMFTSFLSTLFHITLSLEFLVFIFFWPLQSYKTFMKCMNYPTEFQRKYEFGTTLWRHLVNPLITWLPLLTVYTKFSNFALIPLSIAATAYMYTNYAISERRGIPVYDEMNWKSMESHIHVVLGLSLAFGGFFAAAAISKAMRKRYNLDGGKKVKTK